MAQGSVLRDAKSDHLLTPLNAVIAFIDYQPEQFLGVSSKSREDLMLNVVALGRIATDFSVPAVLTTVGVEMGANQGTVPELREMLGQPDEIDRTTMNSWEDAEFVGAIRKTNRKKLILAGLWTEVCVAFPALDALKEGYEVYFVVDAIGGVSQDAHESAIQRMIQAGARPITTLALACELQRDWARGHGDTLRSVFQFYFRAMRGLRERHAR